MIPDKAATTNLFDVFAVIYKIEPLRDRRRITLTDASLQLIVVTTFDHFDAKVRDTIVIKNAKVTKSTGDWELLALFGTVIVVNTPCLPDQTTVMLEAYDAAMAAETPAGPGGAASSAGSSA